MDRHGHELGDGTARICACFTLRKTTRMVTQQYDDALRPSGLRTTQYSLLVTISRNEPIGVTDLAAKMGMDQTTVTRNVRILISQGFLIGAPGRDRRRRLLSLTSLGQQKLADVQPLWCEAQSRFLQKLGDAEWDALLTSLQTARKAATAS